jgi:hypothetical protein
VIVAVGDRSGKTDMKENPVLVNLEKLGDLIAHFDLADHKWNEYIDARWLNDVEWWDARATKAKWKYHALRSAVVIAGAQIPAPGRSQGVERVQRPRPLSCDRIDCGKPGCGDNVPQSSSSSVIAGVTNVPRRNSSRAYIICLTSRKHLQKIMWPDLHCSAYASMR